MRRVLASLRAAAALTSGLLVLAALALAACNDGGASPTLTASPIAATVTPTPAGGSALPLERFHYVVSVTVRGQNAAGQPHQVVITTEGDFQSPDRHAFTHTIQLGLLTDRRSAVMVEDRAWLRVADGPWREVARTVPALQELIATSYSTVRPGFLNNPQFEQMREAARRLVGAEQEINGVPASHFSVGPEGLEFFRTFLAADPLLGGRQQPTWDLWLAQDGEWPVRVAISAQISADGPGLRELGLAGPATAEVRIDISRPNDPTLAVVEPTGGD